MGAVSRGLAPASVRWAVAIITVAALAAPSASHGPQPETSAARVEKRDGRRQQFWPNGHLKSDVTYRDEAYEGEYRTWYESGRPYERRHYTNGHEAGLQQSWTGDGTLYLNYEVKGGRRYGLVNATPCVPVTFDSVTVPINVAVNTRVNIPVHVDAERPQLPYYDGPDFTPHWSPVEHRVAPFQLTMQTGARVSDNNLRGRIYVASFIYTQCAAVCPIVVRQLSRVQQAIDGQRAVIVSYTVTPETDTPARLSSFGRERGIDPSRWWLVTGDRRQIYQLARSSYFADDDRVRAADEGSGAFLHTETLLLVDADGRLRGVYDGTQPHAIDQLIADIEALQ